MMVLVTKLTQLSSANQLSYMKTPSIWDLVAERILDESGKMKLFEVALACEALQQAGFDQKNSWN